MNKFLHLVTALIFTSALLLISCQHEAIWKPTVTKSSTQPGDLICFESELLPLINSSCSRSECHGLGAEEPALNSYNALMASEFINTEEPSKSKIIKFLAHSNPDKRMPPPPDPAWSADKIQLLLNWIEQGAQNTTNCASACDTSVFTYTKVKSILDQNCSGCHLSAGSGGGILLDTYANIKAQAQNGKLTGSIRRLSGYQPMPKNANQLPECTARVIEKWIESGMPEN
jgi:mono/diheme cytochrome c family protein